MIKSCRDNIYFGSHLRRKKQCASCDVRVMDERAVTIDFGDLVPDKWGFFIWRMWSLPIVIHRCVITLILWYTTQCPETLPSLIWLQLVFSKGHHRTITVYILWLQCPLALSQARLVSTFITAKSFCVNLHTFFLTFVWLSHVVLKWKPISSWDLLLVLC